MADRKTIRRCRVTSAIKTMAKTWRSMSPAEQRPDAAVIVAVDQESDPGTGRQKSATISCDLGKLIATQSVALAPTSLNARNASPHQRRKAKIKLQQTSATIGVSG